MITCMKKILFILFVANSIPSFSQVFSTGTHTLLAGLTANIEINGNTFKTKLTLEGPSDKWFAIGFGNSEMNNTDIFMTDGNTIRDAYSQPGPSQYERPIPAQDSPSNESGDWTLISNTASAGTRTIVATRPNDTNDSKDYEFNASEGSLSIIYAYGGTSTYAYHGFNKGTTVLVINTLSLPEKKLLRFEIYHNPSSDLLTIQLQEVAEKSEVSILDLTGRLIKTSAITSNNSSIDVQELSKGIYIVRIATTNQVGVKRFIKK